MKSFNKFETPSVNSLIEAYKHRALYPFYLYQTLGAPRPRELMEFFQKITGKEDPSKHPDFLLLGPEDSLEEFWRTVPLAPTELHYRFFVFFEAQGLSEITLNKLLKTLEEPPPRACLIFINSSGKKLLETVESRAISLYGPGAQEEEMAQLQDFGDPWELFDFFRTHPQAEILLHQRALGALAQCQDFLTIEEGMEALKLAQRSLSLRNSRNPRLHLLAEIIQRATPKGPDDESASSKKR